MLTERAVKRIVDSVDCSPWASTAGRTTLHSYSRLRPEQHRQPLYSPEERRRRDASRWTFVQGVLAPLQFAVFLVSLGLVVNYLSTGNGLSAATASIVVKTLVLYTIMVTGSLWEHDVYGKYLFARPFFWEDVFSMLVLALHTLYLVVAAAAIGSPQTQMLIALAAYAAYVVNAVQFVLKLRAARRDEALTGAMSAGREGRSPGFAQ
ncbi:2-vinyl bacteriochlorophyllide hydratase [Elioraea sp.]|uniref:2-vinyl bacteriochlorophyllide hydratase n=1 Tax=Elioraea sp. TaxID=2185103 RepID=UPI0025C4EC04|nr:2-vinyl bacteriochlorophyllide hydratase [Elioraea sp.]